MNDKNIEIEVMNTAQDYRRVLFQLSYKKLIIAGVLYFIVITPMLWLTFFGAGANPFEGKDNSVILIMLFFALLPILIGGAIIFSIWKQARVIEKTLESAKFIFSDEGQESFSESSTSKVSWNTFYKVQELKEYFLFYPQKNIFYAISKRSFQNNLQIEEFKNLLSEKLRNKAKLKR